VELDRIARQTHRFVHKLERRLQTNPTSISKPRHFGIAASQHYTRTRPTALTGRGRARAPGGTNWSGDCRHARCRFQNLDIPACRHRSITRGRSRPRSPAAAVRERRVARTGAATADTPDVDSRTSTFRHRGIAALHAAVR
jgi:hypothetical protein